VELMAGTFTAKALADGQVANTLTAIYTVPGSTTAYVRTMKFFNTNAATQTVEVDLNSAGTDRQLYRFQLAQNESAVIDDRITLEAGDIIKATTTTATAVNFSVHGVEET